MPRTPRRLLLATAALLTALPVAGASAAELTYYGTEISGAATQDGIIAPGETFYALPNFQAGDTPVPATKATISDGPGYFTPDYLRNMPAAGAHEGTFPVAADGTTPNPFPVQLKGPASSDAFVCGANVPLKVKVDGDGIASTYTANIPTGARGPHTNYVSDDVGDVVPEGQTVDSQVAVTKAGRVKSVRVHIDSLSHYFSVRWWELTLVSPKGTRVRLWNRSGDDGQKVMQNVTFSDSATALPGSLSGADTPSDPKYKDMAIKSDEPLSRFEGEDATLNGGVWHLEFRDIKAPDRARSLRGGRGRSGDTNASQPGFVEGWSLDVAGAQCSRNPVAAVAPEPLVLDPAGGTVIDGSESVDPGKNDAGTAEGAITRYEWDLAGDAAFEVNGGSSATTPSPVLPKGKKKVRLRVTDNDGHTSIGEFDALVTKRPVITDVAASPSAPEAAQPTTLTASANDPDGQIAKYEWDFNGDGVFEKDGGAAGTMTNTWEFSGPQVVRVRVTDDTGATKVKAFIVTVANKPPVAKISASATPAVVGQPITFDASESSDPDGQVVDYAWDLDGDGTFETQTRGAKTVTATFTEAVNRTVSVRVADNSGLTGTASLAVVVSAAPTVAISASNTRPRPAEVVSFDGSGSRDNNVGGSITKYEWDLDGNGSYETTSGAVVTKAYPNPTSLQIRLRVTAASGAKSEGVLALTVANPAVVTPAPTPTPKPVVTPAPGGGGGAGDVVTKPGPGVDTTIFGKNPTVTSNVVDDAMKAIGNTDDPLSGGVAKTGFQAALSVASKQKLKKVAKGGIVIGIKVNAPGTILVKGMVAAKLAKTLGLKPKGNQALAVASGKLAFAKSGSYKFVVKVPKRYLPYVKKSAKAGTAAITLRGAATEKASGAVLAIGKTVTVVK